MKLRYVLTGAVTTLALAGTALATTASATATHWTPADQRLCTELTYPGAMNHLTVPQLREYAYDTTLANGWLQTDTEAMVTYALAKVPYAAQRKRVRADCSY